MKAEAVFDPDMPSSAEEPLDGLPKACLEMLILTFTTKKHAALLKLVGATIVFGSAVLQQFATGQIQAERDKLTAAIHDQALIDKGALINQTSYYVLSIPESDVQERSELALQHAKLAALKTYQAQFAFLSTVQGISKPQKIEDLSMMQRAAGQVHDAASLSEFFQTVGVLNAKYQTAYLNQLESISGRLKLLSFVYAALYLIGGVVLFLGGWIDWRLADEPHRQGSGVGKAAAARPKR